MSEKISKPKLHNVGVASSGGGHWAGVNHIGSRKAFEAYGLKPRIEVGTSDGAIKAAMAAAGHDWHEMRDIQREVMNPEILFGIGRDEYMKENENYWRKVENAKQEYQDKYGADWERYWKDPESKHPNNFRQLAKIAFRTSHRSHEPIMNALAEAIDIERIMESDIDLGMSVTKVSLGGMKLIYYWKKQLSYEQMPQAIMASNNYPFAFNPTLFDLPDGKGFYLDGGVKDDLSLSMLKDRDLDLVISLDTKTGKSYDRSEPIKNYFRDRDMIIEIGNGQWDKLADTFGYGWKIDESIDKAYDATSYALEASRGKLDKVLYNYV
jgi:predicted acylesterase/phospholipase RssA